MRFASYSAAAALVRRAGFALAAAAAGFFGLAGGGLAAGGAASLRGISHQGGTGIEQDDGFVERHGFRRLVARERGVDAIVTDIGPVAAVLNDDRTALVGMLAQRFAGIGAKAAALFRVCDLVCDQVHPAVEADGENIIAVFQE